jgi:hypothetical protein
MLPSAGRRPAHHRDELARPGPRPIRMQCDASAQIQILRSIGFYGTCVRMPLPPPDRPVPSAFLVRHPGSIIVARGVGRRPARFRRHSWRPPHASSRLGRGARRVPRTVCCLPASSEPLAGGLVSAWRGRREERAASTQRRQASLEQEQQRTGRKGGRRR